MSSIQRSTPFTPQTSPQAPTVSGGPSQVRTPSSTTPTPPVSGPSTRVQHQAQQSQLQSQALGQVSSPSVVQSAQQQISQRSPQGVSQSHQQASGVFGQTGLGQQVGTLIGHASTAHQTIEDAEIRGVKVGEQVDNVLEAVTGKGSVPLVTDEGRNVEGRLLSHVTGLSEEHAETAKGVVDGVKKGLQAADTIKSIHTAYQSGSLTGTESQTAVVNTYKMFGGDKTIDAAQKISACCSAPSLDSAKEMAESLVKLHGDDSYASQLTHTVVSGGTSMFLGSTATGYLASAVPVLSFGTAAIDTGVAMKKVYDSYHGQNNVSGLDATKSVITALGSGAGATVAPVIGPLVATGLNVGIDAGVWTYNAISSWFA